MGGEAEPEDDLLTGCERAVAAHRGHPAIARWLRAVRAVEVPMPGLGVGSFPVIEFRDGRLGAVVWSDGPGTWGASGWHPLDRAGRLPPGVLQVRPVEHGLTFAAALDTVVASRRETTAPRPWWRFW